MVVCNYPGGVIGYHQAVAPQLLLIDEYFKVQTGDAVFWTKDEWHETKTDGGLTAIVIESEELDPSIYMTEIKLIKF